MTKASHWQRNLTLLNATSFARTFMIIMPIFVPLMHSYGLDMREIMLLQSIFAAVSLLMELPSGYVADLFGRKRTLILGYALAGAGFTQVLWADTFWSLAVFEVTLGFAMSFVSGCDTALAYESEKALATGNSQPAISRLLSWMNFGEGIAALCAFVLIKFDMRLVLWTQAIVGWIPFALSFWLVEAPRIADPTLPRKTVSAALQTVRQSATIIVLTGVFVLTMSVTYLVAWLNQSLWLENGLPLAYFGLVWGLFSLTIGLVARYSTHLPERIGPVKQFSVLAALLLIGFVALNGTSIAWILTGGALICVFRGIAAPLIKLKVNNAIDDEYRATINSVVGASFRIATLILGPLMGLMVDRQGPASATFYLGLLVIPAVIGLLLLDSKLANRKTKQFA